MTQETFTFYIAPWYRKSPFFEATRRYGCKSWGLYNHMLLPTLYDDPVTEYWALVNDVTLWDVSVERIVEISGPDAFDFTNMLTCRDLTRCAVGQCRYAPLIARRGGIVNDPVLLRLAEGRFWLALADSDAALYAKGVAACVGMDVDIDTPDVSPLQLQGPKAKEVIAALFGDRVLGLRYYFCAEVDLDGIPLVVSRTGWTGEVGYELYLLDGSRGDELWERIMAAGKPFNIRPIAPSEARRIEAGIFNYGSDMTMDNTPFEITGLERLVEAQDADYIGKEVLERIRADGVQRKLVGVDLGGDPLVAEAAFSDFWPVRVEGERAGKLTGAAWSPRLERNIGYAWVPVAHAKPGAAIDVETPDGDVPASVAQLPFIDPGKDIPKS